ncbi:unnamed protein product [Meganyctiphanes norvegica]|uniref:Uncharacterized protein n=1 Tax=Meganyctiphanes norvegica TaxID=48144 RepID=A0AAV2SJ21_MEGNR
MVDYCIYTHLDNILPCTGKSKHDIFRLEYLSACKIMENENNILKILPHVPVFMFEPLLQAVIYKCYLEFINTDRILIDYFDNNYSWTVLNRIDVAIPDSLRVLILNWPHEEFILRNLLPPLNPPVERFPSSLRQLASQNQTICEMNDMMNVFRIFCNKLIKFITSAVFECTSINTHVFSYNLRVLDVSGMDCFLTNQKETCCFSHANDIINVIRNSTINTFGHKIEILADAKISKFNLGVRDELLRSIIKESLNPDIGISVNFIEINLILNPNISYSNEFYMVLYLGRCKYLHLTLEVEHHNNHTENLYLYLPELVGIKLTYSKINVKSLDFLREFKCLEHVSSSLNNDLNLTNSLCNLSNGLKYLNLSRCSLRCEDLESLANSKHSHTLLELNLTDIKIDCEAAVGLTILCQKLKSVKVLVFEYASLNTLPSGLVSKLINAIKDCDRLEFLSIKGTLFSLEITHMIIDELAQNKSLRYLGLTFPLVTINGKRLYFFTNNNDEPDYLHNLCKIFHKKLNKLRHSQLYISWSHRERGYPE